MQKFGCLLISLFLVFLLPLAAIAEVAPQRKALVIGIDAYQNVVPLKKAGNDAQSMAKALERLGFGVALHIDPDRRTLLGAISAFASGLAEGDEAVIFFSGHGVEFEGRNYILATDVPSMGSGDGMFLAGEGIAVDMVLDSVTSRGAAITTLILDACRNNPFARAGTRSLGAPRGLAQVAAPEGTFILYSASQGEAALDRLSDSDADPNSVFTRVLLKLLDQQDLPIHVLARTLRLDVQRIAATAKHQQRPAYYDEIDGDYLLNRSTLAPANDFVAGATEPVLTVIPEEPALTPPIASTRSTQDIVRATQVQLDRIGCDAGVPDGVSGQRTRAALDYYAMIKGWSVLPGEIGSDELLASLEVEIEKVCASSWIAAHVPMALSGDWTFTMRCSNGLGGDSTALLVVDAAGIVRGAVTNQSGNTRQLSGKITVDGFVGEIDGGTDKPLQFDLRLSNYKTQIEGTDAFGCLQTYFR